MELRVSGARRRFFPNPELWVARSWQRHVARMKVVCASCEREGKPGYLGEREPYDNPATTHGLCARHKEQALEGLPSRSFPDAEMLIVVRPNDTTLYEHLQRNLAGVEGVKVILNRRQADRRREQSPPMMADERRRRDKRIRRGETVGLGYTVVRFKPNPPPRRGTDRVDL